jgi:hypothetical protein
VWTKPTRARSRPSGGVSTSARQAISSSTSKPTPAAGRGRRAGQAPQRRRPGAVAVGTTFPPSIPKRDEQGRLVTDRYTGEVEQVYFRLPDEAINLYIEAVKADDPIRALLTAREHGWSAADLRKHIRTGAVPSSYRELAASKTPAPLDEEQALADFANAVLEADPSSRLPHRLLRPASATPPL